MERFFKDPRTIRKFRTGPLGLNIQQLADELFHHGYTRYSIRVRIQTLGRFGRWLEKCRIPLQDLTAAYAKSYVDRHGTVKNGDAKTLRMLLELLSRNASAVSDAPHSKKAGRFGTSCGARPIQLFEGSRLWGGTYAN
jgi:hypothetical protein